MLASVGLEYRTLFCRSCTLRDISVGYDVIAVHYNLRYYLNTEIMQIEQREPSNKYIVLAEYTLCGHVIVHQIARNSGFPRTSAARDCAITRSAQQTDISGPQTLMCVLGVACASKTGGEETYREHSSQEMIGFDDYYHLWRDSVWSGRYRRFGGTCCLHLKGSQRQSYVATDGQSASLLLVSSTHLGPKTRFLLLSDSWVFVDVWRPDEKTGLSFTIAAIPRQRSHSRVGVTRNSWFRFGTLTA
jgi:hypothetical protein